MSGRVPQVEGDLSMFLGFEFHRPDYNRGFKIKFDFIDLIKDLLYLFSKTVGTYSSGNCSDSNVAKRHVLPTAPSPRITTLSLRVSMFNPQIFQHSTFFSLLFSLFDETTQPFLIAEFHPVSDLKRKSNWLIAKDAASLLFAFSQV